MLNIKRHLFPERLSRTKRHFLLERPSNKKRYRPLERMARGLVHTTKKQSQGEATIDKKKLKWPSKTTVLVQTEKTPQRSNRSLQHLLLNKKETVEDKRPDEIFVHKANRRFQRPEQGNKIRTNMKPYFQLPSLASISYMKNKIAVHIYFFLVLVIRMKRMIEDISIASYICVVLVSN